MIRPRPPRSPLLLPLAALAVLALPLVGGCADKDEPATYLPISGEWIYTADSVAENTCPADISVDPLETFVLDYDDGDSFDIELGAEDVTCEIDRTDFYCSDLVFTQEVDGFDVTLESARTWKGEFGSASRAEGDDITTVSCIGADCNLVPGLPCSYVIRFEAEAI